MYFGEKIVALIPARGGSVGVKDKNIYSLKGKPLIAYSIEVAKKSKYIDEVVVTTDSEKIAEISKEYGAEVPFLRPKEYAQSTSKTIDAVIHFCKEMISQNRKFGCIVLLQPTQPLRNEKDIDGAIELFYNSNKEAVVSVSEVNDSPLLIRSIDDSGKLIKLLPDSSTCRRQDMPKYYRINGCIYINDINEINENTSFNDNSLAYVMPKERSVDIDELVDFHVAEYYLTTNKK